MNVYIIVEDFLRPSKREISSDALPRESGYTPRDWLLSVCAVRARV